MTNLNSSSLSLDLNLLRYLVVLVQEKSVSRTAERLHVTQPAVSAAIKRLRLTYNDPILVRSGQTMQPTPRAFDMARLIEPMLKRAYEMTQEQHFEPSKSQMSFSLICSDYVQFAMISNLTDLIQRAAAGISIDVKPANPERIASWMESGLVDLGVGYLPNPLESWRTKLLFREEQVCLIKRNHTALKREWNANLYCDLTHVAISPGGAGIYGASLYQALKSEGLKRRIGLTLPSFLAIPYVVAKTGFVATVPLTIAKHFSSFLPLTYLSLPIKLPAFEISMYWHERVHMDLAHKWLRQQVEVVAETHNKLTRAEPTRKPRS